jgi:hypothetical protein
METTLTEPIQTGAVVPILSVAETAALLECESIIRQGRAAFIRVGHALSRIRDSRLYREKYSTFEDYCLAEWEISDRYARNVRSAADVVDVLNEKQFMVLPASESQARPLTKLPREEWSAAWEEVVGTAPAGRVTASHVVNVVQRRVNRLAGIKSDTEILSKVQSPTPKVIDAGTREERIRAQAKKVNAELRTLLDVIGTADSLAAASVSLAIGRMDDLQYNLSRKESLLDNRRKEGVRL